MMRKILFCAAVTAVMSTSVAEAQKTIALPGVSEEYHPQVSGTIRAKYEYQTEEGEGRFQVRNARLSVGGKVLADVAYKAEIDLSDEGTIKMLDAYARYTPLDNLNFTIGQMRVPFTIDAHRSPHLQHFANRSFIAKQVGNIRDVGATAAYSFGGAVPVKVEAGMFNGSGLTGQKNYWTNRINYSAKAVAQFTENVCLTLSTQAISPNKHRINMYDAGVSVNMGRLFLETEYLYKHYSNDDFDAVHAFNSIASYRIPLRKVFNSIALLGRYDMMTDHSDGSVDENGTLLLTDSERKRLTGGVTLSLGGKLQSDIRINYEKYFYGDDAVVKTSEKDKFVVEFMVHF